MNIPSKSDWGPIEKDDLDAEWAYKNFAGKSLAEAEKMFQRNAFYYQEALISMPALAFNYYAPVFAKYVLSEDASGDSDGASSFLHMIVELLEGHRSLSTQKTEETLLAAAKVVSVRQAYYDADIDIYGRFSELYSEIKQLAVCV